MMPGIPSDSAHKQQQQQQQVANDSADAAAEIEDTDLPFPPLTRGDVLGCMFSSWYPQFRQVTFKSEIIKPLDQGFVDYLLSDGIVLPDNEATPQYHGTIEELDASDSGSEWSDEEDDPSVVANLESISALIREKIAGLGGQVFPRMNWSAPKDASWMATGNTLQCHNPSEIYVLLKSSDKITGDLENGRYLERELVGDVEPELVLRQWCNLLPSMEFRCFIKDRRLVAISQIDLQHYEFLEEIKDQVTGKITQFFDERICSVFPLQSYCFDAYITRNMERIYVVDFEPWTHSVDSCLFEWRELLAVEEAGDPLGLRLFPKNVSSLGHFSGKYSQNRFPIELTADEYQNSISELIEKMAVQR
ncbi:D123-domain-containing protein [Martensiomyces pterosporus]|nr:D123-domain-containing protein [Martensiomyces pterosporus]